MFKGAQRKPSWVRCMNYHLLPRRKTLTWLGADGDLFVSSFQVNRPIKVASCINMLKWFWREICIFTTPWLKSKGWSEKSFKSSNLTWSLLYRLNFPQDLQMAIFLWRKKETSTINGHRIWPQFFKKIYLTPGHMFAKITSQVREQWKCLLIILLILQTGGPSVFFAAHSFPRQPQIERNRSLGVFHSCLSNPTGWCCHETMSILTWVEPEEADRSLPASFLTTSALVLSPWGKRHHFLLFGSLLMLQDTLKTQRWSKLSRSPCWTNGPKGLWKDTGQEG